MNLDYERRLRAELDWLRARYDSGAVSSAMYAVLMKIEVEIGWLQHVRTVVEDSAV